MKKQGNFVTDTEMNAIDRASQAQYRLEVLVAHVEGTIRMLWFTS
jgi:hypothetical protein